MDEQAMVRHPRKLTAAEEMRLCTGFVAQPFVSGIVAFAGFPFLMLGRDAGYSDMNQAAISVALGTFMFAIGITLVLVVPTAVWVLKRRALSFKRALLFGLAIGNLPVAVSGVVSVFGYVALRSSNPPNYRAALGVVLFSSLIGVTGAAVFWAIAIRGRDFSRDPIEDVARGNHS